MISLTINNYRRVSMRKNETIYKGDNKFSKIYIYFPVKFNDEEDNKFIRSECSIEMRCYISETEYLSYILDSSGESDNIWIMNDLTADCSVFKVIFVIRHGEDTIGTTNGISIGVSENTRDGAEELTPRKEFDDKIREQAATIAEQEITIENQGETITQQSEQITELSGEVTELTTENTRLEALTDTQRETIQNMLDNPPQPKLYTPPVVTPSGSVQQINPPTGYDGLTNTVVDRVSAAVDPDIVPENIREGVDILGVEGTYNPFPEHSVGGIYITEVDEDGYPVKYLIKDWEKAPETFPIFFNKSVNAIRSLKEIVFENCPSISYLGAEFAVGLTYLSKFIFPENIKTISDNCFKSCASIQTLLLPETITTIGRSAFRTMRNLREINLPASLTSFGGNDRPSVFYESGNLELVRLGHNFNCNGVVLSASTRFTAETIVACLEALADRTGQTAYTITFGSTNLDKLTAEQKAIATNKNWNLA